MLKWFWSSLPLASHFCWGAIDKVNSENQVTSTEIHSSMPHRVWPGGPRSWRLRHRIEPSQRCSFQKSTMTPHHGSKGKQMHRILHTHNPRACLCGSSQIYTHIIYIRKISVCVCVHVSTLPQHPNGPALAAFASSSPVTLALSYCWRWSKLD